MKSETIKINKAGSSILVLHAVMHQLSQTEGSGEMTSRRYSIIIQGWVVENARVTTSSCRGMSNNHGVVITS